MEQARQAQTKMTKEQIAIVSRQIISALHYLNEREIIYGDIKPENILFKDISNEPTFCLANFGSSKVIDSSANLRGTRYYLASEVYSGGPQDVRLDIWSFGVVIYEMLTGLALDQLSGLTDSTYISGEWHKRLENACGNTGDLAKMLTLSVERRITIDSCYASDTFPVLPDTLPSPFAAPAAPNPPALLSSLGGGSNER